MRKGIADLPRRAHISHASNNRYLDALQTYDVKKRAQYYEKAQELIHEDACWVYIAHSNQNIVFRNNVQGYSLHPTSRKFFYPVWIK
ncbi:hypothetical protein ES708_21235 [subsurface metagenome]